ncbi:Golgin imh1 [Coemansia sp. RSA 2320]|nr:Golgin imh1 [Coemansia sp. RSA 2320]
MSSDPVVAEDPAGSNGVPEPGDGSSKLTSDVLQPGDVISEALLQRLSKLEKYEHKLAEVARVYRNLNAARKSIEAVLKKLTPVQSIADVDELEAHLSNLNGKTLHAGEQIGALTELDKSNRAKIGDLESQLHTLKSAEAERATMARELDRLTKERKVVEGQLERTSQKLRLDVKALEADKTRLEAMQTDVGALAAHLTTALLAENLGTADDCTPALRELQLALVAKCGAPEGLVPVAEVESATTRLQEAHARETAIEIESATARLQETHAQETAQLKDILRKELADSEDRITATKQESDGVIAELRQQLEAKLSVSQANCAPAVKDSLTAERVSDIVAAALDRKLALAANAEPEPEASPAVAAPSSKKKGKNKRKTTGASTSAAPSPVAMPAKPASDADTVQATSHEISTLIALIEGGCTVAAPAADSRGPAVPDAESIARVEYLSRRLDEAQEALAHAQSQRAEAQKGLEQALADRDETQSKHKERVDRLQAEIEDLRSQLAKAEGKLAEGEAKLTETEGHLSEIKAALDGSEAKLAETTKILADSEAKHSDVNRKLAETDQKFAMLKANLAETDQKNAVLKANLVETDRKLAEAKAALTTTKTSLTETEQKLSATRASLAEAGRRERQAAEGAAGEMAAAQAVKVRLEEHVRAVDADLANSRAQFAEKSREAAQTAAQLHEAQYALERERRAARGAADAAAAAAALAAQQLAAAQEAAQTQRAHDAAEMDALRRAVGDLDQHEQHASRAARLETRLAERQAELDAVRAGLQRAEEASATLRAEVDRLHDVERDCSTARGDLARVAEERALSEQRWRRVHRDLKEELRRLHRERQPAAPANGGTIATTAASASLPEPADVRSNSLTIASVSSLLRAATAGSAALNNSNAAVIAPAATAATEYNDSGPGHKRAASSAAASSASSSDAFSLGDGSSGARSDSVNVEYLRNVLFRFFNDKERRAQLVPVLSTLLKCKSDEIRHIQLMLQ